MTTPPISDPVAALEESVGTKLLKAMLIELKMLSPRYNTLNEEGQADIIERLRLQIGEQISDAVTSIAAKSYQTVPATIMSVAFKEEVKVTLEMGRYGEGVHAVADAVNGRCMLVLCDVDEFTAGMDAVRPTPPQADWIEPE